MLERWRMLIDKWLEKADDVDQWAKLAAQNVSETEVDGSWEALQVIETNLTKVKYCLKDRNQE